MPIVIKAEDFTQTEDRVFISVPLNGVKADKADIYANDSYIKINFAPFFYEADLLHRINTEESEATVGDGCVKFNVGLFESSDLSAEEIKARRAEAFQRELDRVEQKKKDKAIKKREDHYKLVQEQLNVERAEKARVENIKLEEKRIAEDIGGSSKAKTDRSDSAIFDTNIDEATTHESTISTVIKSEEPELDEDEDDDDDDLDMEEIKAKVRKEMDKLKGQAKPKPRESGIINVKMTSRGLLPTSTARETEDAKWVHRINQAWEKDSRERADNLYDPVSAEEKNPIFLKDKGNAFFKKGNLHAAINAFTASLELDSQLIPCLTNRAICHLKLENYEACVQDCSKAMDIITTEQERKMERDPMAGMEGIPAYHAMKVKLCARRAAAYIKLNKLEDAMKDYQMAVVMDPKNEALKVDLINIKKMLVELK
ncbi:TPR-like protein [Rhizoclosmatium globosum]|uniref:TPR-like protein n=1 Tax=Rhizoclosmatium globosum TaxID=329046 RepID=A0A1Y2CJ75_9FUNG|nr:TPR-like protein [Rhizoclosmatium globosum]|eukprot:ORY46957.1 TPR-like protein [Rhizoclosmatium globosum]